MNQILDTKLKKNINQILSTGLKKNVNQILSVKLSQQETPVQPYFPDTTPSLPVRRNWFRFQFVFSLLILVISIFSGGLYFYYLEQQENLSNDLITNYNIHRLYSSTQQDNQELFNGLFRHYPNTKNQFILSCIFLSNRRAFENRTL